MAQEPLMSRNQWSTLETENSTLGFPGLTLCSGFLKCFAATCPATPCRTGVQTLFWRYLVTPLLDCSIDSHRAISQAGMPVALDLWPVATRFYLWDTSFCILLAWSGHLSSSHVLLILCLHQDEYFTESRSVQMAKFYSIIVFQKFNLGHQKLSPTYLDGPPTFETYRNPCHGICNVPLLLSRSNFIK